MFFGWPILSSKTEKPLTNGNPGPLFFESSFAPLGGGFHCMNLLAKCNHFHIIPDFAYEKATTVERRMRNERQEKKV